MTSEGKPEYPVTFDLAITTALAIKKNTATP